MTKNYLRTGVSYHRRPPPYAVAWDDFLTNAFYATTALDTGNRVFSRPNITGALSFEDSFVDIIALASEDVGTTAYTRHQKIIRIVRQNFGYMVVNDLKYGLLTTYIRTWFFYRQDDNPDNICISPAVHINQSHTDDCIVP
ncbi:15368_t:CDS:2 [Funneliformis geosporum]|nr:15368_t:CDS:2 [Funneliformis geosporum]